MQHKLFMVLILSFVAFSLGACSEITEYFIENPAEVSSCANLVNEFGPIPCVECNSETEAEAEVEMCGMSLAVRCNADDAAPPVYGIAFGIAGFDGDLIAFKGATAWVDSDLIEGPSGGDDFICHEQSGGFGGFKHESKCAFPHQGNSKKEGLAFESEIKYDPAKDDC